MKRETKVWLFLCAVALVWHFLLFLFPIPHSPPKTEEVILNIIYLAVLGLFIVKLGVSPSTVFLVAAVTILTQGTVFFAKDGVSIRDFVSIMVFYFFAILAPVVIE